MFACSPLRADLTYTLPLHFRASTFVFYSPPKAFFGGVYQLIRRFSMPSVCLCSEAVTRRCLFWAFADPSQRPRDTSECPLYVCVCEGVCGVGSSVRVCGRVSVLPQLSRTIVIIIIWIFIRWPLARSLSVALFVIVDAAAATVSCSKNNKQAKVKHTWPNTLKFLQFIGVAVTSIFAKVLNTEHRCFCTSNKLLIL